MAQRTIAFDVEPSERRYRLRLARYKGLAEAVAEFVREREATATDEPPSPPAPLPQAGEGSCRAPSPPAPLPQAGEGSCATKPLLELLDVGMGSGRSLRFIEGEGVAGRFRFFGLDNSDRRLAGVYRPSRWRLVKADVEAGLPFGPEAFDVCICEQVLEHLDSPAGVIGEVARVLRPGGLAIFGVPVFPPGAAGLRRLGVAALRRWFGVRRSHCQTFTAAGFARLVEACGPLRVVGCRGFRIISGGPLAPLEDHAWWYGLNRRLGRMAPSLSTEVQVLARKCS